MANDDEDRKTSWSSWFAPGDVRQAPKPDNDVKRSTPVASPSQAQQQDTPKPESNPLITFKHFVDDTLSALTNFRHRDEEVLQARNDEYDQIYKRWTGAELTRHLIQLRGQWISVTKDYCQAFGGPSDEARATARMLLLESARRNNHVSPSKIVALFQDPAVPGREDDWPHWLSVEWFKLSKDSPVNLEADPALAKYDTKWRHAFEDLLEAALDKPMSSRERVGYRGSIGPNSTWRGPGLDWMLSLQCRGILPPQLPTMYRNSSVASELFAAEDLDQTVLGRWCQQHSPTSTSNFWDRIQMDYDYDQLLDAIETPAPEDTTFVHRKLEALGMPHRPGTFVNAIGANTNVSPLRQYTTQHATADESTFAGGCSDELGRAVSEATNHSHEPRAELDIYEQMYNDWLEDSEDQTSESARCPDDLGRVVGDAARQQAARAFADEENGLIDDGAGALTKLNSGNHALQDYQMQLMLLDQQNKKRLAMARAEAAAAENDPTDCEATMSRTKQRDAEQKHIQQELDASARCPDELGRAIGEAARQEAAQAFTESETSSTLNGSASSKLDWLREVERMIERRDTLQRNKDNINEFYIDTLVEQLQALRDDHERLAEELAEELADGLEKLEQRSRILEQKDRQSSHAHPQKPAPVQADASRPQVLSTLTTTETTRLPDGSVKTTVVLKRRFANGLEETQESTQTSFEEPTAPKPISGGQEPSKKGWFWW